MDRTIVIYKSKYGATEKYAQWIGQELDCPVVSADDFGSKRTLRIFQILECGHEAEHAGGYEDKQQDCQTHHGSKEDP